MAVTQNCSKFIWTKQRIEAARLLADDSLTDEQVADTLGLHRRTITSWKAVPEFAEKIAAIVAATEARILQTGIARKVNRVKALDRRWEGMKQVVAERAAAPEMQSIPGGKTGLLVIKEAEWVEVKQADGSSKAVLVPLEVAVDTGLLKELRELEKQAAQVTWSVARQTRLHFRR